MPESLRDKSLYQPRPRRDGRRREVPRRVRGAAQGRARGDQGHPTARSSPSSTSCTPSSAPAPPARAPWTPATCSSRCWPAASCASSARRRSTSTASTSRRTPRSSAASSRSSSASRRVEDTIAILRGLKERYEAHHKVEIEDAALVAAASLSDRYISGRQLPDKAIDLVDEAASRLRMEIDSSPVEIDELRRAVDRLKMEELHLERETDDGLASSGSSGCARTSPTGPRSSPPSTPAGRPRSPASTGSATSRPSIDEAAHPAREGAARGRLRDGAAGSSSARSPSWRRRWPTRRGRGRSRPRPART